jgi:hypothetical protein
MPFVAGFAQALEKRSEILSSDRRRGGWSQIAAVGLAREKL